MKGLRRGRTAWTVPLLLFVAILLFAGLAYNIANLDTGGEAIPDVPEVGGTPAVSGRVLDLYPLIYLAVFSAAAVLIAFLAYVVLRRKRRDPVRHVPFRRDLAQTLILFFLFLLILIAWRGMKRPGDSEDVQDTITSGGNGTGVLPESFPTVAGIPLSFFLAGALLAALVTLVFLLRPASSLREIDVDFEKRADREAAAEAIEATIEEIELGTDARGAVLRCFRTFCALLGRRGVVGQEALTPRELEVLAVHRLGVSGDAARELTSLFEEARYSVHPVDEEDRVRALRSLERIRGALGD